MDYSIDEKTLSLDVTFEPRWWQKEFLDSPKRFKFLHWHRRAGKSLGLLLGAQGKILSNYQHKKDFRAIYVAPTYGQAKRIIWDYAKKYMIENVPEYFRPKAMESELALVYPWGAKFQLFGADTGIRGQYGDLAILDERQEMPRKVKNEVILPLLSDRKGELWVAGTARGHNHFYEEKEDARNSNDWFFSEMPVSKTKAIDQGELDLMRRNMGEDAYQQEFECDFEAAIRGTYYGDLLNQAKQENRIKSPLAVSPLPIHTAWDLGVGDSTSIWFYQKVGPELAVIDYYECSGVGLDHYKRILEEKMNRNKWIYGDHWAPHDISVRELGSGKSRLEIARGMGLNFRVVRNIPIDDGIAAVRFILPRCYFNEDNCYDGIEKLKMYRKAYSEKRQDFEPRPYHDFTSHAADAFRYLCVSYQEDQGVQIKRDPFSFTELMGYGKESDIPKIGL